MFLRLLLTFVLFFAYGVILFSVAFCYVDPLFGVCVRFNVYPIVFPTSFREALLSKSYRLYAFQGYLVNVPRAS